MGEWCISDSRSSQRGCLSDVLIAGPCFLDQHGSIPESPVYVYFFRLSPPFVNLRADLGTMLLRVKAPPLRDLQALQ